MLGLYFFIILSFGVYRTVSFFESSTPGSDFNLAPASPRVKNGGTLYFVCTVKTTPRPAIWFILKEAVVKQDGHGYKLFQNPLGSVLRISPVTYAEYNDQDVLCTARFSATKIRYRRTRIRVYENGTLPLDYPAITRQPASTNLRIGQAYHTLSCEATGHPRPNIHWMKDHVPVDDSNPWMDVLPDGSLKLHGIDQSMNGIYECAAENTAGIVFSDPAFLNVSRQDVNMILPAAPTNLTAAEITPNTIRLTWDAPEETYTGTLVSYELFVFENFTKSRSRATIVTGPNPEYTLRDLTEGTVHKIQVAARTTHGMGQRTDTLMVKTEEYVPGRALYVHVHIINSTAIRIGWSRPRSEDGRTSGIIRAYVVETKGLDDDGKPTGFNTRTRIPDETELTVTGLEASSVYSVRIWGVTRKRAGNPSAPMKVKTFRSANTPPRNLTMMAIDDTTVQLNWAPPSRLKERIITHEIMYYPRVHPSKDQVVKATALFRSAVVHDLKPNTDYVFQIRGVTLKGLTDWSRKLVFRSYGRKPDPPLNIKISRLTYWSLGVSWDPPDYPVSAYKIYYHRLRNFNLTTDSADDHQGHTWSSIEVQGATSAVIHRLEEHLPYAIKIQSQAPDGTYGPVSQTVVAGAELAVLNEMVQDLIVKNTTSNITRVVIVPPISEGFKNYTLAYSGYLKFRNEYDHLEEIHDGPFHEVLSRNVTEFTIKNLRPNALYDINVTVNYLTHNSSVFAIHIKTDVAAPIVKGQPHTKNFDDVTRTIEVEFPVVSAKNGKISHMFLIVVPSYLSQTLLSEHIDTTHPDKLIDIPDNFEGRMMKPYVAASFKKRPDEFVLGDGKTYGGFKNKPIKGAPEYVVFVRVFSLHKNLWSDSPYSYLFNVNPNGNDGKDNGESKRTGVYIFLLICVNLSIFICCGMRSASSGSSNKQPLCVMGQPPFDVACLRKKQHHESAESLTEKDELNASNV
ncbi:receptor-type tyrosine-protein phosphatase S-like [Lineus longissimus]|uniref:receptor-type tyrosine-protein phosphatase S-like n=1 Tax=Lineus longissimus TaxID=88925 RepID=UPI002B4CD568